MILEGPEAPDPYAIETGTVWDEFLPIYRALAPDVPGRHRGFSQSEVDAMDLTVIAQYLGAGSDVAEQHDLSELADLVARRQTGEDVTWS